MNLENIINIDNKPQVFIKKIIFNDGKEIELRQNSIIIFTGSNNSGKSQILKDIELCLDKSNENKPIVIKECEFDYHGMIFDQDFIKERFFQDRDGFYQLAEVGSSFASTTLEQFWNSHTLHNGLYKLFIRRLSTEIRLSSSNELNRSNSPEKHPVYKLNRNENLAQKISDYFYQAFGVDLVVNRNEMQTIPLHVGFAPDKKAYTIDQQDEYYNQVAALPKLQDQGDGMRSYASILLDTFTSEYSITLIDEPEAFLHPPQARLLGKMLAQNSCNNRQFIIATHSEDFLLGLLDAENDNVSVIRINRDNNINNMSILTNDEIKNLWNTPLLRYSNILSGLFHEKVVVCESDYDCLFYQALIDAVYENENEISPDILFTHSGGKNRIKDVVKALKAVDVPVVAIYDFDIINDKRNFKLALEAFNINFDSEISSELQIIYDSMNSKNKNNDAWDQIKKTGKAGFMGDAPKAYSTIENKCKSVGLLIVPVGEMECFVKTVNKEKKDWVYYILENYNLAVDVELEEARKFIQLVLNYKLC